MKRPLAPGAPGRDGVPWVTDRKIASTGLKTEWVQIVTPLD